MQQTQHSLFFQIALDLFKMCPEEANKLYYQFCQYQKQAVEPLRLLPVLLYSLSPNATPKQKNAITQFLFHAYSDCGWT